MSRIFSFSVTYKPVSVGSAFSTLVAFQTSSAFDFFLWQFPTYSVKSTISIYRYLAMLLFTEV